MNDAGTSSVQSRFPPAEATEPFHQRLMFHAIRASNVRMGPGCIARVGPHETRCPAGRSSGQA